MVSDGGCWSGAFPPGEVQSVQAHLIQRLTKAEELHRKDFSVGLQSVGLANLLKGDSEKHSI